MNGPTYVLPDGEELDFHDRNLRISRARQQIERFRLLRQQADEALAAVEDTLTDLHHAQRL